MKVVYADEFVKQFHKLPQSIQHSFRVQERIFKKNWRDSRLHTKKLKGALQMFSFRITRAYHALFMFVETHTVLFATIGHRKDIYR
ncbi:MAG: hypothetical protein A3J55_03300 [Candidatus Ryanbacteria bacterium RIFCSPHIGHO2_02_FULL_45_17b]|uniref:Plasmid stabilization protein n=1 Tax=Candidatus Ryanbacteria bacterium RIFCSPHIGHO2_01_FULL_45_22 TaxID=1802114 RepID=A0A1G2G2F4_9BACT|nr:MAG: hypothetical protein A2719_04500 [Candidatus Ryanbacteria bacterium RIFCSPHIGHO2_01_FULL_45_22]OGZ47488.1 MAG: hypothetical protein A3J55_03300 [Candidatus Ryanbacteria bacterium RIFCSPHIGHO2_02_FULL_45_17b]